MVYDLQGPVPDVVHSLHPQHLILCFEQFGDALTIRHLLCQQEHLLRGMFVDVGKVCIQLPAGQLVSSSMYRALRSALMYRRCRCPQIPMGRST